LHNQKIGYFLIILEFLKSVNSTHNFKFLFNSDFTLISIILLLIVWLKPNTFYYLFHRLKPVAIKDSLFNPNNIFQGTPAFELPHGSKMSPVLNLLPAFELLPALAGGF